MSTVTAVLSLTHEWLMKLDDNQEISCIFFDFKKAFDSIPHALLMGKLDLLHLPQFILSWLDSYLTKRQQRVVVDGVASEFITVVSGVPQGSILGPLLFLIYIDSISQIHLLNNSKRVLYTDDILLYKTIFEACDFSCLQKDVNRIDFWSSSNAMTFNVSKCKQMLLSRKRNPTIPTPMLLNGEVVNSYKYLGFVITSDLSWSSHINYICSKAKKTLGMLYRQFSNHSSEPAMIRLYLTLVRPVLEYGAEVWHPHLFKDIQALENVQKFALRICSKQWQMSYPDLLNHDHFQISTLENRRLFLSLCTFFKIVNKINYFLPALIPTHTPLSVLRSSNPYNYSISFSCTTRYSNSFILRTSKLWNNLPVDIKSCTNFGQFKNLISSLFL